MKPDSFQIEAVCRAIDAFEVNLHEDFTVQQMAEAACYSLFHFCRVFAAVTRLTPYQYMLRRRLAQSAIALQETDFNISRVGLDCCFNSPEVYSRAFKRYYGVLPSQWRNEKSHPASLVMPRFDLRLLDLLHNGISIVATELLPEKLHGIMTYKDSGGNQEPFLRSLTGSDEPVSYVRWYPPDAPERWYSFTGFAQPIKIDGLVSLELPRSEWFTFATSAGDIELATICIQHILLSDRVPLKPLVFVVRIGDRISITA